MMGPPTQSGCFLLFLRDGTKLVGDVRIEGVNGTRRLEVTMPYSKGHPPRLAIIAPESVERCAPCSRDEAALMAAAIRRDAPVATPAYDEVPRDDQTPLA
jgi:hypothetical protein